MKKNILFLLIATCLIVVNGDEELDPEEATVEIDETPADDVKYESPKPSDPSKIYLADHFDDPGLSGKVWIKSQAKKEGISEDIAKYDGEWAFEPPLKDSLKGDSGLVLKTKAKHAAISAFLKKPFVFSEKPIVVQYEVTLQEGQECGGSYIKLLSQSAETKKLDQFHDKTPYSIMFGPDKCGNDHKLHFIFKHINPLNGSVEEKHCKQPKQRLDELIGDKLPHLYTLELRPDNNFEISIDGKSIHSGSLLEDFTPAVNPPAEIDDPTDHKPDDWDEREKISDPEATKPEDWDEDAPAQIVDESAIMPEGWLEDELPHIPDPAATKPEDWDSEMDGEWEPPLVDNPACADAPGCGPWEPPLVANPSYKGKWRAPLVDNPNYKGKWRPKKIPNPEYFNDEHPFRMQSVVAVGFELWSMSQNMLFDNIIITDDIEVARQWASDSFEKKRQKIAQDSVTLWGRMMRSLNYSPKAWGLYFIYCLIPIGIYVWYLVTCVVEESFIEKIADLTVKYPALWALYILVLGIPVVFILYLCCRSSPQEKEESDLAERKKTDAVTKDAKIQEAVPEVDEEEDIEEEGEDREKKSDSDTDEQEAKGEDSPGPEVTAAEGTRKRPVRKE